MTEEEAHCKNKSVGGEESDELWTQTEVRTWSLRWSLYPALD